MQDYFKKHKDQFQQGATVDARHVLVKTKAEAEKVRGLLAADSTDANWKKVAKQYSIDTGTKNNGGELGSISKGRMVKAFENAAFSLKVNEISCRQDAVRLARHRGHQEDAAHEADLRAGQEHDPADAARVAAADHVAGVHRAGAKDAKVKYGAGFDPKTLTASPSPGATPAPSASPSSK